VAEENLSFIYEVNDGTEKIKVILFSSEGEDAIACDVNTYVYVVGRLGNVEMDRLTAFTVRKVTDFNQIPYHMLQACFAHLFFTRGLPPGSAFGSTVQLRQDGLVGTGGQDREEALRDAIMAFVRQRSASDGPTTREIGVALSANYSLEKIAEAIETLRYNGEIWDSSPNGQEERWSAS
jgi:hypothetical protein